MQAQIFWHVLKRKSYMKHLDKIYKHNGIAWFTPVEVFKIYEIGGGSGICEKGIMEFEMAFQDRVMEEIKDKKNVVEAYVYPKHEAGSDYQTPYGVG